MKRPSLAASIKAAAAPAAEEPPPAPAPVPPMARMPAPSNDGTADAPKSKRGPSREGRKAVYAFMDPAEHQQLKRLSVDTGRTIDALVAEAVHLLFAKHGVQK